MAALGARAATTDPVRRICVLDIPAADDPESQAGNAAFLEGLAQFGWTDAPGRLEIQPIHPLH
jgi:hypothetical protein